MPYLDQFRVGQVERFGAYAVTREEVVAFAERYDPQPFHLSDTAAAETHFGRLAASGWHTAAMTMAMIVRHGLDDGVGSLGSPGIDELRWLKPVHPGDVLACESEVLEVTPSRSKPDRGVVRSRITTLNQAGEPVMRFTAAVFHRVRAAPSA